MMRKSRRECHLPGTRIRSAMNRPIGIEDVARRGSIQDVESARPVDEQKVIYQRSIRFQRLRPDSRCRRLNIRLLTSGINRCSDRRKAGRLQERTISLHP